MKIDTDIMVEMIRNYFAQKLGQPRILWDSYPMKIDGYAIEPEKIFLRYKVSFGKDESTQLIRIDRKVYEDKLANKEFDDNHKKILERDKKIENLLKPTFTNKIRNLFNTALREQ